MKALKITVEFYVENENPFFPFTTKIAPALQDAVSEVARSFNLREVPIGPSGPFPAQSVALVEIDTRPEYIKAAHIRQALRERYGGG